MIHCSCDKIHRMVRDLKLSAQGNKRFSDALLASTYAWSVNYKPHGSGAFGDEKHGLLHAFFESEEMDDCQWFHKYIQCIRLDFQLGNCLGPSNSHDVLDEHLWAHMQELPSFLRKKGLPKPSRWFAWHEQAQQQLSEWYASRCLLEWYFKDSAKLQNPDEITKDFKSSRSEIGGLQLVYRALSAHVHEACHVMLHVSRPCWAWYTRQVTDVKTAQDGLEELQWWSVHWHSDSHLLDTVKTMYDVKVLATLCQFQAWQGRQDEEDLAALVFQYGTSVLSRRLWTMTRYSTAPECWACVLVEDTTALECQQAMHLMQNDWRLLCLAEQSPKCKCLLADLQFLFSAPVRLACVLFEVSGWDINCQNGREILKSILKILPDNKIVEDAHQAVRVEAKAQPNLKLTPAHVQSICLNSAIFSSRQLRHPALLSKREFLQAWGKQPSVYERFDRKVWQAKVHKLPKSFGGIMKKKTWTTLSEEQYAKSAAAWHWIRFYTEMQLSAENVKVSVT